ncbi:CBS domain-containing protein [Clostridia bacterium]|nr:CBS domain-containing protein [Clostridia bacterium]
MLVSQMMNPHVVSVAPDENASLAARLLSRHNVGSLPVCSKDGRLKGIVTDRDIVLRCVAAESDPNETSISEIMSRGVVSVAPTDDAHEAARLMAAEQIRRLPVVDGGRVVGMVSLGDVARRDEFDMEAAEALSEISRNVKRI